MGEMQHADDEKEGDDEDVADDDGMQKSQQVPVEEEMQQMQKFQAAVRAPQRYSFVGAELVAKGVEECDGPLAPHYVRRSQPYAFMARQLYAAGIALPRVAWRPVQLGHGRAPQEGWGSESEL